MRAYTSIRHSKWGPYLIYFVSIYYVFLRSNWIFIESFFFAAQCMHMDVDSLWEASKCICPVMVDDRISCFLRPYIALRADISFPAIDHLLPDAHKFKNSKAGAIIQQVGHLTWISFLIISYRSLSPTKSDHWASSQEYALDTALGMAPNQSKML